MSKATGRTAQQKVGHAAPHEQPRPQITVQPARYVTIPLAALKIGLTPKAIECKIASGVWLDGSEYRRGPDGRIYIDMLGVERWIEGRQDRRGP